MNSGVFCLYMMLAFSILFIYGWGERYVSESRMNQKFWALFLFFTGAITSITLPIKGMQANLSVVLTMISLLVYFLYLPGIGLKLKLVLMAITAASVSFTLMVIVPHEPIFYFVSEKYLYPLSAVCASYLFSRKPLLTAASSVAGILSAGMIVENKHTIPYTGTFSIGSQELMEMAVITFLLTFCMDKAVAATEMFLLRVLGYQSGDLESDPT